VQVAGVGLQAGLGAEQAFGQQKARLPVGGLARRVLANLNIVLSGKGLSLADVVKTTVFLKNFADFARMNTVYAEVFGDHRPARTTVEVSRLPLEALVEIECIAALPA